MLKPKQNKRLTSTKPTQAITNKNKQQPQTKTKAKLIKHNNTKQTSKQNITSTTVKANKQMHSKTQLNKQTSIPAT